MSFPLEIVESHWITWIIIVNLHLLINLYNELKNGESIKIKGSFWLLVCLWFYVFLVFVILTNVCNTILLLMQSIEAILFMNDELCK